MKTRMNGLGIIAILFWLYMLASVVLWTLPADRPFFLLASVFLALAVATFGPLATFSYGVEGDALNISWRILSVIPLIRKRVSLGDVASVKVLTGMGSLIWPPRVLIGNPFVARPVVLVGFKRRMVFGLGWAITKHVALTPRDPEGFAHELGARLAQVPVRSAVERNGGS